MKKLRYILPVVVALCLPSCASIISLPAANPDSGKASIKGATVYKYLVTAQYSYVLGADGVFFEPGSRTKQVAAGKRRLALGASHAAGIQSFAEVTAVLEAGKKYIVTADQMSGGLCHYKVLELPDKKVIASVEVFPVSGFGLHSPAGSVKNYWKSKGWKTE